MSRPRVLMLGFTPTSSDPRILRHVSALREDYDVVTMGTGPAPAGVARHIELPAHAHHLPRTPAGLAALTARRYRVAYRHVPIVNAIRACAPSPGDFDVIVANDLITLPVALEFAGGKPVVADMHEYEPRQFEELWQWRLALQGFYTYWCGESLHDAAAVITVAPGIAREYERVFGVHCAVVMNAAPYVEREPNPTGDVVKVVHSGQAMVSRHIHTMIEAAADLTGARLDLLLTTTTQGAQYLQRLRRQAARTSNVRVLDPVPMHELNDTLAGYDIGLSVLYPSSFNILHALPNKFFDFVQARLGLLVGPSPEMATIVREHSLGSVADDFDALAIRECLERMTPTSVDVWKAATHRSARTLSAEQQAITFREVIASVLEA